MLRLRHQFSDLVEHELRRNYTELKTIVFPGHSSAEMDLLRAPNPSVAAYLFALMVLQSLKDNASEIRVDYSAPTLSYVVNGNEYSMVSPPMLAFADLVRELVKAGSIKNEVSHGTISLVLPNGEGLPLSVQHEGKNCLLRVVFPPRRIVT